jgi:FkbM family methyltransferase
LLFSRYRVIKGKYGLSYRIDKKSALDYHIVQHGILQDWIAAYLPEYVPQDGIVFDIGANAGLLSLPFAFHVPKGKVYAFEADGEVFEQLQKNMALNPQITNVIPMNAAMQDNPNLDRITFYKRRAIDGDKLENRGLSSLENIPLHQKESTIIPCTTIDKYRLKIDFIKIDVEGSEYKVLKGGEQTIAKHKPVIHYEYSTTIDKLNKSNNTEQSFNFLKEMGYRQFAIVEEQSLKEMTMYDPRLDSVNILSLPSHTASH